MSEFYGVLQPPHLYAPRFIMMLITNWLEKVHGLMEKGRIMEYFNFRPILSSEFNESIRCRSLQQQSARLILDKIVTFCNGQVQQQKTLLFGNVNHYFLEKPLRLAGSPDGGVQLRVKL